LLSLVSLAVFVSLLIVAALTDLRERRIPNWLPAGIVILYPVQVMASPDPVAWLPALAVAATVFAAGALLFARQLLGGGDVKLMTAVALWAGLGQLSLFAVVTSLAGGALAMATLFYQRWAPMLLAHLAAFGLEPGGRATARAEGKTVHDEPLTLPYGIAIAAGGIVVALELLQH